MHPAWDTSHLFSFTEKNWLKLHKSWTEVQSIKILEKINICISRERPADRDPAKNTEILLKFFSFFFPIPLLNMNIQVKLTLSLSLTCTRTDTCTRMDACTPTLQALTFSWSPEIYRIIESCGFKQHLRMSNLQYILFQHSTKILISTYKIMKTHNSKNQNKVYNIRILSYAPLSKTQEFYCEELTEIPFIT